MSFQVVLITQQEINYYFNYTEVRWEGLADNASTFLNIGVAETMVDFLRTKHPKEILVINEIK